MTNAAVRLRDIRKAGREAQVLALSAAAGFALLGVMLAVFTGYHEVVTSTTVNVGVAVFGTVQGLVSLKLLDEELREVDS